MSDSLWPHEPQHARPPCTSPTPGVHPNTCPFSRWCHPTISSSVVPFSSCPQSFPASYTRNDYLSLLTSSHKWLQPELPGNSFPMVTSLECFPLDWMQSDFPNTQMGPHKKRQLLHNRASQHPLDIRITRGASEEPNVQAGPQPKDLGVSGGRTLTRQRWR